LHAPSTHGRASHSQLLGYVIILCVPAPYLVAVFAGLTAFYYALQRLYMPASRQLRRLEMACKSPLITSLAEASSESGLATVRALGRERKLRAIMTTRLDSSQKPYLALWAVRHWLSESFVTSAMSSADGVSQERT
jgi:hypothetical protein